MEVTVDELTEDQTRLRGCCMSLMKKLSVCVEIVYPNGTKIYLWQTGHTTLLPWVLEGFQTHLKDAECQWKCVFAMALAMNQWNGVVESTLISPTPVNCKLGLTFDFRANRVYGAIKGTIFEMDMLEWVGTPVNDLPFVESTHP